MLSIPRLITLPLVSLLSSSLLHSLSFPLILSLVCLINLSSHSVTCSHIHMRYTCPTIDTITLRIRGGKWKLHWLSAILPSCKMHLFFLGISVSRFFFPSFFVPFSALPVLLEHFSFCPSFPRSSTNRQHPPLNFILTELFISLISFLPYIFPRLSVHIIIFLGLPPLHVALLPWSGTGLWHYPLFFCVLFWYLLPFVVLAFTHLISTTTNARTWKFYVKTFKIAPTCLDPKIIFRELVTFKKTLAD